MPDTPCTFCLCSHPFKTTISCKTDSTLKCHHIEWMITNFSFIVKQKGEYISSPKFMTGTKLKNEWYLKLYPSGEISDEDVGLFLYNDNNRDVIINYSFAILNKKGEKCHSYDSSKKKVEKKTGWGYTKLIKREELCKIDNGFLPNDTLTIVCELQIIDDCEESCTYRRNKSLEELSQGIMNLFRNSEFSDVTIATGTKHYQVHRNVLAARSPVFAAIFKHEMLENRTNVIQIADIEARVMEQALIYIYSGHCPAVKEMALDLVAVAEKYDLGGLKKLCEETLSDQLTSRNSAKTLLTADLYCLSQLKNQTLDYIYKHLKEIRLTSGWKEMTVSHPQLELEILRAVIDQGTIVYSSGLQ